MTEGAAPFNIPGISKPCLTWYKTIDSITTHQTPLIILHGGPAACHDYLLPLIDLSPSIPLIFYDQIGNGKSTHLPEKAGDEDFWTIELFRNELDNLISHLGLNGRPIDILGHSWGGLLALEWAAKSEGRANLRRLVLGSSLASMEAWLSGVTSLRDKLPEDVLKALLRAEETRDFASPEYEAAAEVFYKRHLSLARPWPAKEVQVALEWLTKDPSKTYETMYGPSEVTITGTLRDWTSIPFLDEIKVPTLLINGSEDEAQDVAMQPLFNHVKKVKWVTIDNAAHFCHVDQREKFMKHVKAFLVDS